MSSRLSSIARVELPVVIVLLWNRKVKKESATGSVAVKDKVKMTITIQLDAIDFDAKEGCASSASSWPFFSSNFAFRSLRLSGRNVEENEFVKMGAFHTIQVELHRNITIQKPLWDDIALERLKEATDVSKRAEVSFFIDIRAIVMLLSNGS